MTLADSLRSSVSRARALAASAAAFGKNRRTLLVSVGIVLAVLLVVWSRLGFTLDFNRFFAAYCDPETGECGPPQEHLACDNMRCVVVSGPGQNSCGTDADCGPSCGSLGGSYCSQTNSCPGGRPDLGRSWDCVKCCGDPAATPTPTPQTPTPSAPPPGCNPTFRSCNGNSVFQHYTNCNGQNVQNCSPGTCVDPDGAGQTQDAFCQSGPTPTPSGQPGAQCPAGYDDWGAASDRPGEHFCWKIVSSSTLTTAACQPAGSGQMCQTWAVVNNTSDNWYNIFIGFHDPVKGCAANATAPSGGLSGNGKNFAPGEGGNVTVCYDGGRHDCGRIQLDGCWKNARTGECRDTGGGLALGAVIDYGRSCTTPTPPPTTITPPPTTITPPPTTITPPPTTITPPPTTITPPPTCTPAVCVPPGGCFFQGGSQCACGSLVCPTDAPLVCAPVNQTVGIWQNAFVQAGGGAPPYTWSAPGSGTMNPVGAAVSVAYASAGSYPVTVRDSQGRTAVCTVVVPATPPPPTYSPPPVTQVPTGPAETAVLALIVSAIVTLLYVGYTATDAFQRHEAESLAKRAKDDIDTLDFRR